MGVHIEGDEFGVLPEVLAEQDWHFEVGRFDGFHEVFERVEFTAQLLKKIFAFPIWENFVHLRHENHHQKAIGRIYHAPS